MRPASPTSLFVFGVAPGRTTIAALSTAGAPIAQYDVTVRPSRYGAAEAAGDRRPRAAGRIGVTSQTHAERPRRHRPGEKRRPTPTRVQHRSRLSGRPARHGQPAVRRTASIQVNLRVRIAEMSAQR